MTDHPFDKESTAPEFRSALETTRTEIAKAATLEARRVWGIIGAEWADAAFTAGPDWAFEQLARCTEAVEITIEVMQTHMVTCFQGAPPAFGSDWEKWERRRRRALSEAQTLCRQCIKLINDSDGKEIDKSTILEQFAPGSPSRGATRGGFER